MPKPRNVVLLLLLLSSCTQLICGRYLSGGYLRLSLTYSSTTTIVVQTVYTLPYCTVFPVYFPLLLLLLLLLLYL